ncbi:hypothetical protein [Paenibacillus hemerocallicola]|uniref:hypothetical protein n=1 Tax=Paenibacillus hemerocallicola TaxID=1172614 RepID=UPI00159EDEC0|nr:hypothetical protein [Paenibacillus hemerocallicola]
MGERGETSALRIDLLTAWCRSVLERWVEDDHILDTRRRWNGGSRLTRPIRSNR